MSHQKKCGSCHLNDGLEHDECELCLGWFPTEVFNLDEIIDSVQFRVIGGTREEKEQLQQKFRREVIKVFEEGKLPTNEFQMRSCLLKILKQVLIGHYNTY